MSIVAKANSNSGNESYLHKYAKQVLVQWLREAAEEAGGYDEYASFTPITWRVNRKAPCYGIYQEWAILPLSNELKNPLGAWDECLGDNDAFTDPPLIEELTANGYPFPEAVLDVAVQHKGNIVYGLEVVVTSTISAKKRLFLERINDYLPFKVFEVSATWILSQTKRPTRLLRLGETSTGTWVYEFRHRNLPQDDTINGLWEHCMYQLSMYGCTLTPGTVSTILKAQDRPNPSHLTLSAYATYQKDGVERTTQWILSAMHITNSSDTRLKQ